MRRKFSLVLLVLVLAVVALTGCSGDQDTGGENVVVDELQDGKYLVKTPVSDHGNYAMATMEVSGGQISEFKYMEILADSGEEKNPSNYNYPEGLEAIANLNEQFKDKKDLNEVDFDAVSGATQTKEDFRKIVNDLLVKSSKGEKYQATYKDGEYVERASEGSHGWIAEIKLVVKEGQVVGVDYCELAEEDMEGNKVVFDEDNKPVTESDGKHKTEAVQIKAGDKKSAENYAYLDGFDVVKAVEKQIIDNNGTEDINLDGISGATSTQEIMLELAAKVLEQAK